MPRNNILRLPITLLTGLFAFFVFANEANAEIVVKEGGGRLAVIKGVVRDKAGNPISKATVAVFRLGTSKLLKQVTASKTGRFFTRILPGTYTILAVAQGFNPVTLKKVQVNRSKGLIYGFKLERSGSGKTLPEKRIDRNSPKWRIRAAARRSIYQNREGKSPIKNQNADLNSDRVISDEKGKRKVRSLMETFVASTKDGSYTGVNFVTFKPVSKNAEIIFAGQIGTGKFAPKRLETSFSFRPNDNHQISLKGSVAQLGKVKLENKDELLGQMSVQALDQWRIREGVVVVFGLDYSRFIGAGKESLISPRFGFQIDVDQKTRIRTAYTTRAEDRTWQKVIQFENSQVLLREPTVVEDIVVENDKPRMNKNRRLEFGVERVLDNRSSVEANVFFDAVTGRGVGLSNLPFDSLDGDKFGHFVANQHGKSQGVRAVYTRRLDRVFTFSAGYSFGKGQKLSNKVLANPADVFESDFFQTFYGELKADLKTGTSLRTIYRLSPEATVFAIDPFQGRLAIYDPGLSIMVTQTLPSWGLPIDAEAVLDARNLFDRRSNVGGEIGMLQMTSQRRFFRGGILVRF